MQKHRYEIMGEVARQRKVVEELQNVYIYLYIELTSIMPKHIFHDYICDYICNRMCH